MRYSVVVLLTQAVAFAIGGFILWAFIELSSQAACLTGARGFCLLDTAVLILLGSIAFVAFAFALLMFKAYSIR